MVILSLHHSSMKPVPTVAHISDLKSIRNIRLSLNPQELKVELGIRIFGSSPELIAGDIPYVFAVEAQVRSRVFSKTGRSGQGDENSSSAAAVAEDAEVKSIEVDFLVVVSSS